MWNGGSREGRKDKDLSLVGTCTMKHLSWRQTALYFISWLDLEHAVPGPYLACQSKLTEFRDLGWVVLPNLVVKLYIAQRQQRKT